MATESDEITDALNRCQQGSQEAKNQLAELLDQRFRKQASWLLRHEPVGVSLSTSDLLNEGWIRLLKYDELVKARNQYELFRAFSRAMRQSLVDRARRRRAERRGGDRLRTSSDVLIVFESIRRDPIDVLTVEEAFDELLKVDARACEVIDMRIFGGYEIAEIAEALSIASRTVERDAHFARHFLRHFFLRAEGN